MLNVRAVLAAVFMLLPLLVWSDDAQKGADAYNSADYETALAVWQPLAEGGDAESQFGLGQMYGNGFGVTMDDALALRWYGLAAGQGHAQAQCNLAVMHQNGWGVPQNDSVAMTLYALAAEQGNSESMVALGRFYAMDFMESYDPVLAYKWFSLAYQFENIDAGVKRDTILDRMTAEQTAEGDALIAAWSDENASLLENF